MADQSERRGFTPGDWRATGSLIWAPGTVDTYGGGVEGVIAQCLLLRDIDCEGREWTANGTPEANARLIAAAPDLYEACEALLAALHPSASPADRGDAEEQARAALSKANGRDTGGRR